jgi:hypothetical protein
LRGWRLGVAGVNAVSRATLNMRPWTVIVKHLNHKILRFYFRSDARYREIRTISRASLYFRIFRGVAPLCNTSRQRQGKSADLVICKLSGSRDLATLVMSRSVESRDGHAQDVTVVSRARTRATNP